MHTCKHVRSVIRIRAALKISKQKSPFAKGLFVILKLILQRRAEVGNYGLTCDSSRLVGCEEEKHICDVVGHARLNLEVAVRVGEHVGVDHF